MKPKVSGPFHISTSAGCKRCRVCSEGSGGFGVCWCENWLPAVSNVHMWISAAWETLAEWEREGKLCWESKRGLNIIHLGHKSFPNSS